MYVYFWKNSVTDLNINGILFVPKKIRICNFSNQILNRRLFFKKSLIMILMLFPISVKVIESQLLKSNHSVRLH